jgi:hypothetical protein
VNICCEDTEDYSHQLVKEENLLNNRLLTYVSSDPNDNESITPNHLLLGPREHVSSPLECFHKKMRCAETMAHSTTLIVFGVDGSRNIYQHCKRGQNGLRNQRISKLDDIVKITSENLRRGEWPLGRLIAVHPGEDEVIRVVTVKTQYGDFKRPVTKIAAVSLSN